MINLPRDTQLTANLVRDLLIYFRDKCMPNLVENRSFYLNTRADPLPYAKKIVTISTAATIGDGVEVKTTNKNDEEALNKVLALFKKQTIIAEDTAVIQQGSTYGIGYELCYMSSDETPMPKSKFIPSTNCFVVFDDTVEENSLFGIYFNQYGFGKKKQTEVYIYDDVYIYTYVFNGYLLNDLKANSRVAGGNCCVWVKTSSDPAEAVIGTPGEFNTYQKSSDISFNASSGFKSLEPHNMGRMPITAYLNNLDEQGDFEQVKPTIVARNKISDLSMDDAETIAGNYLKFTGGGRVAGDTANEKKRTITKIGCTKVIELEEGQDVQILTKSESFSMISVFGQDLDNKIYDLSMIVNFSSEEFAGNVTGVALRLKLFPFKKLVSQKDFFIEKLYKRRIKMYAEGLGVQIDVSDISISIKRTWEENILELAQVIATLFPTGLFSDEYLIKKMGDTTYDIELSSKQSENTNKETDILNSQNDSVKSLLRQVMSENDTA